MVPLGSPVVPEVNAMRHTSSFAVSHALNLSYPDLPMSDSSESGLSLPQ
jgi:hypothetical protein